MRLLFFCDSHLSDRPPASRTRDYADDVFRKMEEIRELAAVCDVSVMGGDLFHAPRPRDTSHALVRRTIEFLRDWPTPLFLIMGNHDAVPEQISGLPRTPLGVVLEALRQERVQLLSEDVVVGGVQLSPAHWSHDLDVDPALYQVKRMPDAGFVVKVVHGMCLPPGEYPFKCVTMDKIQTEADLVLLAHMHWTTPPMTFNDTLFVGPGSVSRTSKSESEARRQVQVAIITFDKARPVQIDVEFVPLKTMRPSEDVFQWVEDRASPTTGLLEGYVAVLESGLEVGGLSIDAVLASMEKQAPDGVAERARQYLMDAGQ